jgi:hypothetical protein
VVAENEGIDAHPSARAGTACSTCPRSPARWTIGKPPDEDAFIILLHQDHTSNRRLPS